MDRRLVLAVLGWVLLQAQRNGDWQSIGEFSCESTCLRVRDATVRDEALGDIGSALANQPADNPMRQQALDRAARRVSGRYECTWERR